MGVSHSVDLLDVQQAARLAQRTPETVRRWVWSGRLPAVKRGNKLLIERVELARIVPQLQAPVALAEWAEQAHDLWRGSAGSSASDLVLEDREDRDAGARR